MAVTCLLNGECYQCAGCKAERPARWSRATSSRGDTSYLLENDRFLLCQVYKHGKLWLSWLPAESRYLNTGFSTLREAKDAAEENFRVRTR